jgi:hypothetical protein
MNKFWNLLLEYAKDAMFHEWVALGVPFLERDLEVLDIWHSKS